MARKSSPLVHGYLVPNLSTNERGIIMVVLAMACFATNDVLLKLTTQTLPPFETIFFRSIFSATWSLVLLAATGGLGSFKQVAQPRVLLRNLTEVVAVLGFIVGLSKAPIAEFTALNQLQPIILMLIAGLFLGLKVTRLQFALAAVAFVGALLVAQPGSGSFTWYYMFGVWNAVLAAIRELVGRSVPAGISGIIIALGAALVCIVGTGAAAVLFEPVRLPNLHELALVAGAGVFLTGGHIFIFLGFRQADPGAVSPFSYAGTLFAVVASVFVFGMLPNALAFGGMALIVLSGVGVILFARDRTPPEETVV